MLVHAVLQAGISGRIGAGLALENDRAAVRQYQPIPGQQHAGLPGGDLAVIFADQPRPLRDEQDTARRAVIDVGRHLGGNLTGKIGTDAGDKRSRNDAAGLHDVGRGRPHQALDAHRALARRLRHEGSFGSLVALRGLGGLRSGGARRCHCEVRQRRHRSGPGAAAPEEHAAHTRRVTFLLGTLAGGFFGLGARIGLCADRRDRDVLPALLG